MTSQKCGKCGEPGPRISCSRCLNVYYCSQDCQKLHWTLHTSLCTSKTPEQLGELLVDAFCEVNLSRLVRRSPALEAQREQLPQRHACLPLTPSLRALWPLRRPAGTFQCLSAVAGTSNPLGRGPCRPPARPRAHTRVPVQRGRDLGRGVAGCAA